MNERESPRDDPRLRYVVALDCGHKTFYATSHSPNTGSIEKCDVCGEWCGVIVLRRDDDERK